MSSSGRRPSEAARQAADQVFLCALDRDTRENIAWALDAFAAARQFARNALADDPGELDEDWLADLLTRFAAQHSTAAPTREAREALAEAELEARVTWYHQNPGVPHMTALGWPHHLDYHLALALDHFTAQHSTAAPVSGDLDGKLRAAATAREVLAPYWNRTSRLLTTTEWEDLRTAIAKAIYGAQGTDG